MAELAPKWRRAFWLAFAIAFVARVALGQTGTPNNGIAFDQAAPDVATANGYVYRYYPDGAATGTVLSAVVCTATASPFVCRVNFPSFTPGAHTVTLTAANEAGESAKSAVLSFTFVVQPSVPANVRIVP